MRASIFDFFCLGKKFLVFNLVSRNLKVKYRRSILGILWTLVSPLGMACVYYFVFKVILNIQIPHYLALILSGVLAWQFFSQSILEGMESIVGNFGLLSKIPVPPQIFPFVGTTTNLITLILSVPILAGGSILSGAPIGISTLLTLPLYVALYLITYSLALIFAYFYAYLRDLRHITGILLQIWFYATPVIYQEQQIPEKYRWILFANPLGNLFTCLHSIWVRGEWPAQLDLLATFCWVVVLLIASILVQQNLSKDLVENL